MSPEFEHAEMKPEELQEIFRRIFTTGGYIKKYITSDSGEERDPDFLPQPCFVPPGEFIKKSSSPKIHDPSQKEATIFAIPANTLSRYFDENGKKLDVPEKEERIFTQVRALMNRRMITLQSSSKKSPQTPFSARDFLSQLAQIQNLSLRDLPPPQPPPEDAIITEPTIESGTEIPTLPIREPPQDDIPGFSETHTEKKEIIDILSLEDEEDETFSDAELEWIKEFAEELDPSQKSITEEGLQKYHGINDLRLPLWQKGVSSEMRIFIAKCSIALTRRLDAGVMLLGGNAISHERVLRYFVADRFPAWYGGTHKVSTEMLKRNVEENQFLDQNFIDLLDSTRFAWVLDPEFAKGWKLTENLHGSYQFATRDEDKEIPMRKNFLAFVEQYIRKRFEKKGYILPDVSLTSIVNACVVQSIRNAEVKYYPESEGAKKLFAEDTFVMPPIQPEPQREELPDPRDKLMVPIFDNSELGSEATTSVSEDSISEPEIISKLVSTGNSKLTTTEEPMGLKSLEKELNKKGIINTKPELHEFIMENSSWLVKSFDYGLMAISNGEIIPHINISRYLKEKNINFEYRNGIAFIKYLYLKQLFYEDLFTDYNIENSAKTWVCEPDFAQYWRVVDIGRVKTAIGFIPRYEGQRLTQSVALLNSVFTSTEKCLKKIFEEEGYTFDEYTIKDAKISLLTIIKHCFIQSVRNTEKKYKLSLNS
ncbi:MAG TPA: hypothetical protein VLG12_05065 [Candidatus Saccharimonadales bacterium]|nr:hypothetical protein [Candidatus Saccharimonadales bacterium]